MTAPRTLRPTVSPSDSYAGVARETEFGQVASALASLRGSLGRFTQDQIQRRNTEERAQGQQIARELVEGGKSWAQAIKEKPELAAMSGWVQMGVQETFGSIAGGRFAGDLNTFAEQKLSSATSLEEADEAITQFLQDWRKTNIGEGTSEFFEESFFVRSQESINNVRASLRNVVTKNTSRVLLSRLFEKTHQGITEAVAAFRESGDMSLIEAAAARINEEQELIASLNPNLKPGFNKELADAIYAVADANDDYTIVEMFGKLVKGGTGPINGTREFVLGENGNRLTKDEFYERRLRRMETREKTEKMQLDKRIDGLKKDLVSAALSGQNPRGIMAEIASLDPDQARVLEGLVMDVGDNFAMDDPGAEDLLARSLYSPSRNLSRFPNILAGLRRDGRVTAKSHTEWLSRWRNATEAMENKSGAPKEARDFPYYRNWKGQIDRFVMLGDVQSVGALAGRFDSLAERWFLNEYKGDMKPEQVELAFERIFKSAVQQTYPIGAVPTVVQDALTTAGGLRPATERFSGQSSTPAAAQAGPSVPPDVQARIQTARQRLRKNDISASTDPSVAAITNELITKYNLSFEQVEAVLSGRAQASASPAPNKENK